MNMMTDTQKLAVVATLQSYIDRTKPVLDIIAYKSELTSRERERVDTLIRELGTAIDDERGRLHSRLYEANEYEEKYLKPGLKGLSFARQACWGDFGPHWEKGLQDAIGEMTYGVLNLTAV
jgi:hypothetical protein